MFPMPVGKGIYSTGGRAMSGDLTNRVAVTSPLTVASIRGPSVTSIVGARDPDSTNGPLAVRCVWLTPGATLKGFTLTGGATRNAGDQGTLQCGGGLWCVTTNAGAVNCVISNNVAALSGGGAYQVQLNRCQVLNNRSVYGGGSSQCTLVNCLLLGNYASNSGGGAYLGALFNCTATKNVAFTGGGIYSAPARNSIVYNNLYPPPIGPAGTSPNWAFSGAPNLSYVCTTPAASGAGNITSSPQLLDNLHLTSTSPCLGAGSALYSSGTDIDDEAWANPPSIGCDEFYAADFTGPLAVQLFSEWPTVAAQGKMALWAGVSGRASRVGWSFGDGSVLTNVSALNCWYTWTSPGNYTVTFTAFNQDYPDGVSTNSIIEVLPLVPPTLSIGGVVSNRFDFTITTQPGLSYALDKATNLVPPISWQTLSSWLGDGSVVPATDFVTNDAIGIFRVRTY